MKRTLSLLLTMLISLGILASMQVCVYATNSGETGDCTWTLDGTVLTISGNGEMANYDPSFPAPWGTSFTSVIIEEGVTSIGDGAFWKCTNLSSIIIPNSVASIGEAAFCHCSSLTTITIPYGVTSISYMAFSYCERLASIIIPDSVTSIGKSAFSACYNLKSITIPNSVTSIGKDAFYSTGYYNNTSNWEDDVLYIGNYLIGTTYTLSGSYTIKGGTKTIADYAFSGCASLTTITIPDSVTSISERAFMGCVSLTTITIPNSVTSISEWAFEHCDNLVKVITPCGSYASEYFYDSMLELIHIPGDWIIDTPATSTTDGLKHKECTGCGKTIETELIAVEKSNEDSSDDGFWEIAFFVLLFLVVVAIIFLCIKKKREKIKETNNQTDRQ